VQTVDVLVRDFLDLFSAADRADTDRLGSAFADPFLAGDASGARVVPRAAFLAALPRRREAFRERGLGAAELVSHTTIELDEHYLLVRAEWSVPRSDGGGAVPLSSSYLLHRDGDAVTAIAYLTHRGLEQANEA
jgi:hypothetical protein